MLIEKPSATKALKAPISDTGTAIIGISVARQLSRKMNTTSSTSTAGADQSDHHFVHGLGHEQRGVERHGVVNARRKGRRQRIHGLAHAACHVERIGIGQLIDADDHAGQAVDLGGTRIVGGGQFDARDVLQVHDGAIGTGAHHDGRVLLAASTAGPAPTRRTASAVRAAPARRRWCRRARPRSAR